jgi:5-methylcytosine-specific restriction endonuclease McrA
MIGEDRRMSRRVEGLLLECLHPDHEGNRMRPRGWFARHGRTRSGKERRDSYCRTCRKPYKSTSAAKRYGRGARRLPKDAIKVLWARQRGLCGICCKGLSPVDFHIDHIMPLVRGGLHVMGNLQLAHRMCNQKKAGKDPHEFMRAQGFLL